MFLQDLTCFWLSVITLKSTGQEKIKKNTLKKLRFQLAQGKKHVAGRNANCKCLSRDVPNFPSLGPLQTLSPPSCSTFFPVHVTVGSGQTQHSPILISYPLYFCRARQEHNVRKSTLCVCDGLNGPVLNQLHCLKVSIDISEGNTMPKFSFNMQSQHLPILIYFSCSFFNTTWFYCIYSLFLLHATSWPCNTLTHMCLKPPQVKVFAQKSVLKNVPTLKSLASEAVELY